ncbi:Phage Terminase [compost metagenome]
MAGKSCIAGFDLSETEDFTSACLEFDLSDGRVFVLSKSWIPRKKVDRDNEGIGYNEFIEMGTLEVCEGEYVDYQKVYDWFVDMSQKYSIDLITYDRANAFKLVHQLKEAGFQTLMVRQGHETLNPAMKDVRELLLDGHVVFNNDPLFRWYMNNVKLVRDRNSNWVPTKLGRYRKIDGFAAFLNAHTEMLKRMVIPTPTGKVEFVSINELLRG